MVIILKKLKLESLKKEYKIAENVEIISIDNTKYILKRVTIPMRYETLKEQHKYIHYLSENNIKTANIISSYQENDNLYEIQEYIENNNYTIDISNLIKLVANYHSISTKYSKDILKDNIYSYPFTCRNISLNKLLLGFKEKYYIYPNEKLNNNYSFINNENLTYINKITKIYNLCYNWFVNNYSIDDCIVHNDITSNNVISNDKGLYLIDFDLAIKSSVYVDFIDCIVKRYKTLEELYDNLNIIKKDIIKHIDIYNTYNSYNQIDYIGSLCMLVLKILSFNFYVVLSSEDKQIFNDKIQILYKIINKIYTFLLEVNYDKKSQKRRCR